MCCKVYLFSPACQASTPFIITPCQCSLSYDSLAGPSTEVYQLEQTYKLVELLRMNDFRDIYVVFSQPTTIEVCSFDLIKHPVNLGFDDQRHSPVRVRPITEAIVQIRV